MPERYAKRVDNNQRAVIDCIRNNGGEAYSLGRPIDLLVWYGNRYHLWEVKNGRLGKLTPHQIRFLEQWPGPVAIIRSVDAAVAELNRIDLE